MNLRRFFNNRIRMADAFRIKKLLCLRNAILVTVLFLFFNLGRLYDPAHCGDESSKVSSSLWGLGSSGNFFPRGIKAEKEPVEQPTQKYSKNDHDFDNGNKINNRNVNNFQVYNKDNKGDSVKTHYTKNSDDNGFNPEGIVLKSNDKKPEGHLQGQQHNTVAEEALPVSKPKPPRKDNNDGGAETHDSHNNANSHVAQTSHKDQKPPTSTQHKKISSNHSQHSAIDLYGTDTQAHHIGLKRMGWSSVSKHSFKSPYIVDPHIYSSETIRKAPGYRKKTLIACYNCPQRFFLSNKKNADFKQCPYSECELSSASGMNNQADMMLFWQDPEALPPKRPRGQTWTFVSWEAPPNRAFPRPSDAWQDVFNYTITYLRESDFYLPYDQLVWRDEALLKSDQYYVEAAKRKTKMAAWWVSHCKTTSNRRAYIEEMKKYIPDIDIYGACGTLACGTHGDDCWTSLNTTYRFYLSFENTYCPDYVTEKFYRTFRYRYDIIPVVRGGFQYEKYFPKDTFINAAKFVSAKSLAHHLIALSRDPIKLGKMYKEKDRLGILNRKMDWCDFCEKMHTGGFKKQKIHDVKEYSYERACWHAPNDIK